MINNCLRMTFIQKERSRNPLVNGNSAVISNGSPQNDPMAIFRPGLTLTTQAVLYAQIRGAQTAGRIALRAQKVLNRFNVELQMYLNISFSTCDMTLNCLGLQPSYSTRSNVEASLNSIELSKSMSGHFSKRNVIPILQ